MLRIGGAHTIDLEDYDPEEQCIKIKHRPESGTPIKNHYDSERYIALSGWLCQLLDDWIRERRPEKTDDYGRDPLITTRQGRVSLGTLRKTVYRQTRPCVFSNECPTTGTPRPVKQWAPSRATNVPPQSAPTPSDAAALLTTSLGMSPRPLSVTVRTKANASLTNIIADVVNERT